MRAENQIKTTKKISPFCSFLGGGSGTYTQVPVPSDYTILILLMTLRLQPLQMVHIQITNVVNIFNTKRPLILSFT